MLTLHSHYFTCLAVSSLALVLGFGQLISLLLHWSPIQESTFFSILSLSLHSLIARLVFVFVNFVICILLFDSLSARQLIHQLTADLPLSYTGQTIQTQYSFFQIDIKWKYLIFTFLKILFLDICQTAASRSLILTQKYGKLAYLVSSFWKDFLIKNSKNFQTCNKVDILQFCILLFVFSSMQRNAAEHIMRWDEGGNKGNADREPPYLYLPQGPWAMTLWALVTHDP